MKYWVALCSCYVKQHGEIKDENVWKYVFVVKKQAGFLRILNIDLSLMNIY
ncbi:hypothetical protein F971_00132 [Acinetobacter vivianii]|uniref:Uncharacterized protein n=1 Tax=Acinetobacter vivianii TaxID=1776742 RepID=N8V3Q3_9GAMM|nr:hypothetical protein F971_00132 [Acinetobacter vivianii]